MTNLILQLPASPARAAWLQPYSQPDNWRNQRSATASEMPDTNSSTKSTSNSSKWRRPQVREKSRKSQEERQNILLETIQATAIKQEKTREPMRTQQNNNSEIGSPNQSTIPSPSPSPKSPSSSRHNRTPSSVAGTPPHSSTTPPTSVTAACFSPAAMGGLGAMAGLPNPLGAMGIFNGVQNLSDGVRNMGNAMPRNCSDLMRSMAAKYNNNSAISFYSNPVLNGFPRPPLAPGGGFPNATFLPGHPNENSSSPVQHQRESSSKSSDATPLKRPSPGGLAGALPPHLLSPGAFPGLSANPLMDLSSTQVLINMVRNASNMHQSHLQKTQTDLHNQQFQKQLLYRQQLQQQQVAQQQQATHQQQVIEQHHHNSQKHLQNSHESKHCENRSSIKSVNRPSESISDDITQHRTGIKRPAEAASPLDLSATVPSKHFRAAVETDINVEDDDVSVPHVSPDTPSSPLRMKTETCPSPAMLKLRFDEKEDTSSWTVEDVFHFVRSIDICYEYAENFRDQKIDGACLLLLSEAHLTESLGMKLGPALKLRSFLAHKTQHRNHHNHHYQSLSPSFRSCNHCTNYNNNNHISNNNNNDGDIMCKKLSYPESAGTDPSSPRLSVASPSHTTKSLSPPQQIENGSPHSIEN